MENLRLGILDSQSTRELKNFSFLSQVTPSPRGLTLPHSQPPGASQPPAGPPLPSLSPSSQPGTPGTWRCGPFTLGLLGVLPGGRPTPHSRRSAPAGGLGGRDSLLLCAVRAIIVVPGKGFVIYVRSIVCYIPDAI